MHVKAVLIDLQYHNNNYYASLFLYPRYSLPCGSLLTVLVYTFTVVDLCRSMDLFYVHVDHSYIQN